MNLRSSYVSLAISLFAGIFLFASAASADVIFEDPDVEACYGKTEAESCDFDGQTGLCERGDDNTLRCAPVADPSEDPPAPGTQEEDDDDDNDDSACSTVLANPIVTPVLSFMLGLMILAGVRRRSSRKS